MGALRGFSANELSGIADAVLKENERRKCKRLSYFVTQAWSVVEGNTKYESNWHIDLICEHLEALIRGDITNLLINVPPGSMKSILTSVMMPAWAWVSDPEMRFLSASYGQDLSIRDAVRTRNVVESEWFQELWGDKVQISRQQNQKTKYDNTAGGWRLATSVGGRGTGEHPDVKIIDDPHNVKQAESDAERQTALDWFDQTLSSRGVTRDARTCVVMQRLHAMDLSGHIMAQPNFKTEWEHICLPMRYEPDRMKPTSLGGKDIRTPDQPLLWPKLFTEKKVAVLEAKLGEYATAGQLQQRPAPAGGGIIKIDKFKLWPLSDEIPSFEYLIQSYDTAYSERTTNDPSACTVWAVFKLSTGVRAALMLDAWTETLPYPKLRQRVIEDWTARYVMNEKSDLRSVRKGRRPDNILVEEKSSGISLLQDLRQANVPAVSYNPGRSDKIARAHQSTPLLDAGLFYVLESPNNPGKPISWAQPFLKQCEQFPNSDHDDYVDTWTQTAIYLRDEGWLDLEIAEEEEEEPEEVDYNVRKLINPYAR